MPFVKPTREEVDGVAFRLLKTVYEPEVKREELSGKTATASPPRA